MSKAYIIQKSTLNPAIFYENTSQVQTGLEDTTSLPLEEADKSPEKDKTTVTLEDKSPLMLSLSGRMKQGKREATEKADPELCLSWEELFMGLAELQRVYCNDDDPKPQHKVSIVISDIS